MVVNIQNQENTFQNGNIIRDTRFVSGLPAGAVAPNLGNKRAQYCSNASWEEEVKRKIALAFENKDILGLVKMLCEHHDSPLFIRKSNNSPLYTHLCGAMNGLDKSAREKIELTEAAVFLLLNDNTCELKDVAQAFSIFAQKNDVYSPPLKLTDEFHKRLGLFENTRKIDDTIQKLMKARQNLEL